MWLRRRRPPLQGLAEETRSEKIGASVRTHGQCEGTCRKRAVNNQYRPNKTCRVGAYSTQYNRDGHNKKARCLCAGHVIYRALSFRITSCQIKSDQVVLSPCERHVGDALCMPYLNAEFSDGSHAEGRSCKNSSLTVPVPKLPVTRREQTRRLHSTSVKRRRRSAPGT